LLFLKNLGNHSSVQNNNYKNNSLSLVAKINNDNFLSSKIGAAGLSAEWLSNTQVDLQQEIANPFYISR